MCFAYVLGVAIWLHGWSLLNRPIIFVFLRFFPVVKGTLMQIWKSGYVCVHIKAIRENLAFLILRILKLLLFAREVRKFLTNWAILYLILLFLNVCKQTLHISQVRRSQNVKDVIMWNPRQIIFMWRRRYWQIFKSALVYL